MYSPLNYDKINLYAGTTAPSSIKAYNNKTFDYWMRALFQRATSVIQMDLIDEWEDDKKDFLYFCLFKFGYVAAFKNDKFGNAFQPCELSGYDFYYRPTKAIISNPALKNSLDLDIGKDCEILKLTPDYMGIWDILEYHASRLSELDNAINMSIKNTKIPMILFGRNKAASNALKKVLDLVSKGENAVVVDQQLLNDKNDKESPFQFWDRTNMKSNYLTTDQLRDIQTVLNSFDNEIGIPTVPYEKKERMVTSESESRQKDSKARVEIWVETLNRSFKNVNALFESDMSASYKYEDDEMEVVTNE